MPLSPLPSGRHTVLTAMARRRHCPVTHMRRRCSFIMVQRPGLPHPSTRPDAGPGDEEGGRAHGAERPGRMVRRLLGRISARSRVPYRQCCEQNQIGRTLMRAPTAVVALGKNWKRSPFGPSLESRMNALAAAHLVSTGAGDLLIFSGGRTAGPDRPSEARAMYAYMRRFFSEEQIPEEAVILEETSIDTAANAEHVHDILRHHGVEADQWQSLGSRQQAHACASTYGRRAHLLACCFVLHWLGDGARLPALESRTAPRVQGVAATPDEDGLLLSAPEPPLESSSRWRIRHGRSDLHAAIGGPNGGQTPAGTPIAALGLGLTRRMRLLAGCPALCAWWSWTGRDSSTSAE